jgi:phosphoglycolate phosphatase-like HAD superfamily hydrolase
MKTVLLWDIDGTVLTTGRAGIFAWEKAAGEVAGYPVNLQDLKTGGLTDFAVGKAILDYLKLPVSGDVLPRMVNSYEAHLPGVLPLRKGRVLGGVLEVLQYCRIRRPDVESYLLTGNTAAGAHAKLTYYEIADYFLDGSFARETETRIDIAQRALEKVIDRDINMLGRLFVIGDTPHDVTCGKAIGAKTVAVATGEFTEDELREYGPWRTIDSIPDPESFLAILEGAD